MRCAHQELCSSCSTESGLMSSCRNYVWRVQPLDAVGGREGYGAPYGQQGVSGRVGFVASPDAAAARRQRSFFLT
jgi:hypothetical protein